MSLSVIIPVYNEEKYLGKTFESLRNQDFKDFEVIVVCNGCSDGSRFLAEKYTSKVFNLKEGNVSKARNYGAGKVKNEFLVFLDADVILDENVLGEVFDVLSKEKYFGTVKGKGRGVRNSIYLGVKNLVNGFRPWSHGFVFCDKKSFLEVGGFDSKLKRGELRDFFSRAKGKYKRVNVFVEPSDRRVKNWGFRKLMKYWLFEKGKEEYGAVR